MKLQVGIFIGLCFFFHSLQAQFQGNVFVQSIDAGVVADGNPMNMAWCGGINSIQIAKADLNQDSKDDLILYDNNNNIVRTFINIGNAGETKYSYQPRYEKNFSMIDNYIIMKDYNCDGVLDLFFRGNTGIAVYTGYYQNAELKFNFYKSLWYSTVNGWVNAYVQNTDIPSIEDVDGDGDLDFYAYELNGFYLTFYKNMRVEDGLPCDSIRIIHADKCWGKFYQGVDRSVITNITCKGGDASANKTRHPKNTVLHLDIDNDGDWDILNGNVAYSDVQLYFNNGNNIVTSQDTLYNKNGHQLKMPSWPASFLADIDNDGDKDLLFTAHDDNPNTANYKTIEWYKNVGSATAPNYVYTTDTLIMKDMIDVGSYSLPVLFDYDRDGKKDLFIGSEGYYNNQEDSMLCKLAYYRNTSSGSQISFELVNKDFLNLSLHNHKGIFPSFGDITGDDIDDLIFGTVKGTFVVYKNMAANNTDQPNFQWFTDSLQVPSPGKYATPFVYDFDEDGKNDLLSGNQTGRLVYYRDTSNNSTTHLKLITTTLGNIRAGSPSKLYGYSAPFVGKMDNTGKLFLLMGNIDGTIERYDSFRNNLGNFKRIDSNYSYIQVPFRSTVTAADLNGDGKYEMFIGNKLGGLLLYRQLNMVGTSNIESALQQILIYPNPTTGTLHFITEKPTSDLKFSLHDISGKWIQQLEPEKNQNKIVLPNLAKGFYFIGIEEKGTRVYKKLLLQ